MRGLTAIIHREEMMIAWENEIGRDNNVVTDLTSANTGTGTS